MDCIEGMKLMANGSVDAVIADLPTQIIFFSFSTI